MAVAGNGVMGCMHANTMTKTALCYVLAYSTRADCCSWELRSLRRLIPHRDLLPNSIRVHSWVRSRALPPVAEHFSWNEIGGHRDFSLLFAPWILIISATFFLNHATSRAAYSFRFWLLHSLAKALTLCRAVPQLKCIIQFLSSFRFMDPPITPFLTLEALNYVIIWLFDHTIITLLLL